MIEPRELAHSDGPLQAALIEALEENAMLRRALEERSIAPGVRRWVGRTIATLILALGVAIGALYAVHGRNVAEFQRGFEEGSSGKWLGAAPHAPAAAQPPQAASAPAAGAAVPAPAAAPAPPR